MASAKQIYNLFNKFGMGESLTKAGISKAEQRTIRSNIRKMDLSDEEGGLEGYMSHLGKVFDGSYNGLGGVSGGITAAKNVGVFNKTKAFEKLSSRESKAVQAQQVQSEPTVKTTPTTPRRPESTALQENGTIGYSKRELEEQATRKKAAQDEAYRNSELYKAESGEYTGNNTEAATDLEYELKQTQRRVEQGEGREMTRTVVGRNGKASINEATGKEWTPEELAAKNGFSLENGKPVIRPTNQGTNATSSAVNAAEAEKAGGATAEATRNAATQVPTAEGGGTTEGLSFDNYSRDAQAAIIKEQGKNYWGRSVQERFHLDSMDRRYSEINKMKAGEERNAAIERFNQDLQSGPGFNDYMNGNQVYGKAAGVGVAALTASAVMGDGRRSNAQLYSSPF